jgi:hypothetical protein
LDKQKACQKIKSTPFTKDFSKVLGKPIHLDSWNYTLGQEFNADLSKSPPGGQAGMELSLSEIVILQCILQLFGRVFFAFCENSRFLRRFTREKRPFPALTPLYRDFFTQSFVFA